MHVVPPFYYVLHLPQTSKNSPFISEPPPTIFCPLHRRGNMARAGAAALLVAVCVVLLSSDAVHGANLGINWGTMASHIMLPSKVVDMIKANGIKRVKLFDADSWTVSSLAGSGIEVMVAIPNDQLHRMSKDYDNAKVWVKKNVTKYLFDGGVDIRYKSSFKLIYH